MFGWLLVLLTNWRFGLLPDIGKKKKLIDTGFSGFSGYLDKVVRGRELVFPDYWTPWLAGRLFIGCLDAWIDVLINQLLTQK